MTEVTPLRPEKKSRVFLWVFLAVQVFFLLWIIFGVSSAASVPIDCSAVSPDDCQTLHDAQDVGAGIGAVLIVTFWFFIDAFLGVGYGVYRLAKRP